MTEQFKKIILKRSSESSLPKLDLAEFGFTTDKHNLYIGTGTGNKIIITGDSLGDIKLPDHLSKQQLGLDRVNNTSDLEKPLSLDAIQALNKKASLESLNETYNLTSENSKDLILLDNRLTTQLAQNTTQLESSIADLDFKKPSKVVTDNIQNQINNLVLQTGDSSPEVAQARGTFDVLNERSNAVDDNIFDIRENLYGDIKGVLYKGYYNPDGSFTLGTGWYHFIIDGGQGETFILEHPTLSLNFRVMQWDVNNNPIIRSDASSGEFLLEPNCARFAVVVRIEASSPASVGVTPLPSVKDLFNINVRKKSGIKSDVIDIKQTLKDEVTEIKTYVSDLEQQIAFDLKSGLYSWTDGTYSPGVNWQYYEYTNIPNDVRKFKLKHPVNGNMRLLRFNGGNYLGHEIIQTNEIVQLSNDTTRIVINVQGENATPLSSSLTVFSDLTNFQMFQYEAKYNKTTLLNEVIALKSTVGGFIKPETPSVFKVLMVGNSFSDDTARWLWDIGKSSGIDLVVGVIEVGGGALQQHWNNIQGAVNAPFHKWDNTGKTNLSIPYDQVFSNVDWDVITFQQASANSGQYATFQPYLTNLKNYAKGYATNQNVQFGWNMTWAYSTGSAHGGFANYNNDQITMYNTITNATQQIMQEMDFDIVIPTGTAIQNARTNSYLSDVGDELTRDGYHLNYGIGRFIVALTLFESLVANEYKRNIMTDISFYPSADGGTKFLAHLSKISAKNAVLNPFKVTEI